jgi:hypothetical protein
MPYRFILQDENYTDYASGKVFYSLPGQPAFPVRLILEIFQRCLHLHGGILPRPCHIFDPCCGSGYHLSVLAYKNWEHIGTITASDVAENILEVARRNFSLLSEMGLQKRIADVESLAARYGKSSHVETLDSAQRLRHLLEENLQKHPIHTHLFQANVFDPTGLQDQLTRLINPNCEDQPIDFVISDIPYGQHSQWQTPVDGLTTSPVYQLLQTLWAVVPETCILAITSDKGQKIAHPYFQRLEKFKLGKRQVVFLKPLPTGSTNGLTETGRINSEVL